MIKVTGIIKSIPILITFHKLILNLNIFCKSKLEFLLQRQEFLKHVESKNFEEALKFAQKWPKIQTLMNPNLIEQLKTEELPKFLGLLVCSPEINTKCVSTDRYANFLDPESMWSEVLNQFHRDNLQIFSDFSPSLLTLITVLGISLIKSKYYLLNSIYFVFNDSSKKLHQRSM